MGDGFDENDAVELYGLKLIVPYSVYFPEEDTELCINYLTKWKPPETKNLKILEMGCGPGTLSLYLSSILRKHNIDFNVIGVDINPLAVDAANYNCQLNGLQGHCQYYSGDLFEPINRFKQENKFEPFNLIIFNPPYLASDKLITQSKKKIIDRAWDGGKEGNEVTISFLSQIEQYIITETELIFISSSLVPQKPIEDALMEQGFSNIQIQKKRVFFEDILLYHCIHKKN
jgi:HemK-related putative methylase